MTTQSFNPLYPMLIHKYEEFIPDQNASVIDKINAIIQTLNQVGTLTNDVVKDWNTVYQWCMNDGLQTDVNNKIDEELAKGTFDAILTSLFTPVVGDLTTLQTADKGNLVAAINDLQAEADSNKNLIGDLTTLTTADKDTLVHAINNNVASLTDIAIQLTKYPRQGAETDDTARIQRALNASSNSLKRLIFQGNTTYQISSALLVGDNTTLVLGKNTTIQVVNNSANLNIFTNADTVNGNKNIAIIGGILDGNISNQGVNAKIAGIFFKNCTNVNIKGTEVKNCSTSPSTAVYNNAAILIGACSNSSLERVIAHDNNQCGIQIEGEIGNSPFGFNAYVTVNDCIGYNNGNSGIDVSGGANYVYINKFTAYNNAKVTTTSSQITINAAYNFVDNCTAYRNDGNNSSSHYNVGHSSITFGVGAQAPNSRISNCYAQGDGADGIKIDSSDYVVINGFTFDSNGHDDHGISITNSKYFNISNFQIIGGGNFEQLYLTQSSKGKISNGEMYNGVRGGIRFDTSCSAIKVDDVSVIDNNQSNTASNFGYASFIQTSDHIAFKNCHFANVSNSYCLAGFYVSSDSSFITTNDTVINQIYTHISPAASIALCSGTLYHNGALIMLNGSYIYNNGKKNKIVFSDTVPPTSGSYEKGDVIINSSPTVGAYLYYPTQFAGTLGTLTGVTGSINNGSNVLTVNDATNLAVNMYITIAGSVTSVYRIVNIIGTTVYLDVNAGATVSAAAVGYRNPTFLHEVSMT